MTPARVKRTSGCATSTYRCAGHASTPSRSPCWSQRHASGSSSTSARMTALESRTTLGLELVVPGTFAAFVDQPDDVEGVDGLVPVLREIHLEPAQGVAVAPPALRLALEQVDHFGVDRPLVLGRPAPELLVEIGGDVADVERGHAPD